MLPDKVVCHCCSYISIPVIKQHDQGHLEEEAFNWTYSFSVSECVIAEQRYGGRSIWEFMSWSTSRRQRGYTGDGASLWKPQSYPSDTLPTVPYFPIFSKELHQLGQSIQTYRVCGSHSHPIRHKLFTKWFYPLLMFHYKKTMEGRELIFNFE